MPKENTATQTVQRIVRILRCFTTGSPEIGVMAISRQAGLHKSTTSRLLASLEVEGLVDKNPDTGKYRLGLEIVNLAGMVLEQIGLRQAAQIHLRELADQTQETINIAVLHGDECINVESIKSPQPIQYAGQLGRRNPLHCTSTGKIFLAFMTTEQCKAQLTIPLKAFTSQTITNLGTLEENLKQARLLGYAAAYDEFDEGLSAIAAPIRDFSGQVIAAVSISGPSFRMGAEQINLYATHLMAAAQKISSQLGYYIHS